MTAQYTYYARDTKFYRSNKLSSAYDAEAKYGVEFDYSYNGKTKEIFEYANTSNGKAYGTKLHGYKRSHQLAVYRDYGKDQIAETADDYLTFKVLNRTGRTICAYTTDNSEQRVLGSSAVSYTSNSNRKANNLLAANAYTGQPGVNLLRNGDAEDHGSYWSAVTTSTDAHWNGASAFKLDSNTPSFYQLADLEGNKTYTFSGYIRLDQAVASGGVCLVLHDANTGAELAKSQSVTAATARINGGWQRLTVTYKPSSRVVVKASVISSGLGSNVAYADCLQLEREDAASTYNLVETGSFEELTSLPQVGGNIFGWYYFGSAAVVNDSTARFGAKSIRVSGGSGNRRIGQDIPLNASAGSTFLISGWGKANALPSSVTEKSSDDQPYFGLVARIYYADGTSEPYYFSFDPYFSDWQERSGILLPSAANQSKAISSVTIVAAYDNNVNTAYFDNISLRLEPSQTYRYDENGNPVAATQPGAGSESATYANGIDLTSYTAANGSKYTYTYNSAHDVTSAKVGGLIATTTYNVAGNVTGAKLSASGTSLYMQSTATATPDKNHTETVTDANGATTTYAYNTSGQVIKITNAKDQVTNYTYDPATLRTESTYREGLANIDYAYTDGRLTSLDRKTFRERAEQHQYYTFAYNEWGQPTTTKVGSRTLSTNAYYAYNGTQTGAGGNLRKTTYGNGQSVSYTYDNLDRLVKKQYNSGEYTEYAYNAEGALAELRHCSIQNGQSTLTVYRFEYDSLGRLVRSGESVGDTVKLRTEHIYDAYNRLSKQKWVLGNKRYSEAFAYSDGASGDGSLTSMTTGTGDTLSFGYDALKRLQTVTAKSGSSTLFTTAYAYCGISAARTTPQVEFRNVRMGGTILEGKKYVYDELGNITEIRQSTGSHKLLAAYKYDVQGQLERELYYDGIGEATANITTACHYTYDSAGNLLKVEKGAPKSAGVLVITSEQTYTYGDSDWNDLLTAVNGERILYDGAGNPTSYRRRDSLTYDMSWSDGRRLSHLSCYEEQWQIAYTYDADGIRTSKNVDGCLHSYVTQSGKVVRETIGSGSSATILDFIYDESGRPFALNYSTNNGSSFTTYYYILNLQGDVVKLIRYIPGFEYEEVASYEYDAWGNILSQSGSMAEKNPLRYRGYYYDSETGFYYLQSRYYDPAVKRFLNADIYASTDSADAIACNMFAYCNNGPILFSDPHGYSVYPSTTAINDGSYGIAQSKITNEKIVAYINYDATDPVIIAVSPIRAASHSGTHGNGAFASVGDPLYMVGTYQELRLLTAGTGYEVHHLVEKRFLSILNSNGASFKSHRDMPSVVLTKAEHRGYTNSWRSRFPYGGAAPSYGDIKQFYTLEYGGKGSWLDLLACYFN